MAKELKLFTPEEPVIENNGTLETNVEELKSSNKDEQNTKLLEQINHKLDLLLSIEGGES